MPKAVLAIDQGTTGTTALVIDRGGTVLGRAYAEITQLYPAPGWVEHDADEIWRVSLEVAGRAVAAAGLTGADLAAIGLTNQRETTVVWDRRTGRPVHRAVVWQSRQTAGICERLRAAGHEGWVRERTGLVLDAYFSASKIRWVLDRVPDGQAQAESGDLLFGTVDSWLLWQLTGGQVHATDPTNASRTLLYDIHQRRWATQLLELFDVPRAMLPQVRPSAGVFGTTRSLGPLPAGVPVSGIAGDQQAALYGQGCWRPGMVKATYGTGSFVVLNTGAAPTLSEGGLVTTVCCDATGAPAYALEGSVFTTGAAVQWLRDELGLIEQASDTETIGGRVADTMGVYVVPAFAGLGAPHWDMHARGAIVGLTRGSGRAEIIRATLDSIAYQTRDVVEVMNRDSGVAISELRVDGGAAVNDVLMQFQADILGIPVVRPMLVETTAAGAAFLAGLGVGFWSGPGEIEGSWRRERLFEPAMPPARREELCAGWQRAVRQVLTER
ncbi:MAG: glycerol kinase GlpK [Thermoanaerobaculales bacterium]|jgi:glycerol kinase|nr:glycerol kinase GlpK [Thermoanaerobaculales bacterium]